MSHYFTDNRNLKQNRREISFRFLGVCYSFITDNGVFSKDEVDLGSIVLLDSVCKLPIGSRVLDLGCGYGVIGIVLKSLFGSSNIIGVDTNSRCIDLSKINADKNNVNIEYILSSGFSNIDGTFSSIICNPPIRAGKAVIYQLFEDSYKYLETGGYLWIVIRKSHGAQSAKNKLIEIFSNCELINRDKGFWVLRSKKIG
ncbi:MAG: class I SAM-dependent methyltransferase [Anaerorhabdus sp.]